MNTRQESFPILKPMNLPSGLEFPLSAFLAYKASPPETLTGLSYSGDSMNFLN